MKKNVLTLAFIALFAVSVFSQEEVIMEEMVAAEDTLPVAKDMPESGSSVIFDGSPYDFIFSWKKKKKAKESHWTGLGYAFLNLDGLAGVDLNLSRSHAFFLNLIDYIIPFNQNWLMATGLGFDWSRYHFRGNNRLQMIDGKTFFVTDAENEYRASRLLVYYATIPVLLEYQTKINRNNSFFIYGGVEGLVKLYSKSQVDVKIPEGVRKDDYRDLNLLPLNFRFTARIGVEYFSLFGYYQPVSMFEKGKGPEVYPCGIGMMLNF
ncbi:MAG: PorT family protein [Dysgonamonadaceae bacterium]|jgi:hypothetical protein|nr:PorT family protein [Dysgonamonadaceae bacterium]